MGIVEVVDIGELMFQLMLLLLKLLSLLMPNSQQLTEQQA
jgi:hypothetical protein